MHRDDTINSARDKPDIFIFSNGSKGSLDTVDKLCAAYNFMRTTRLYKVNNVQTNLPVRVFLENIGNQFLEPYVQKRFYTKSLPKTIKSW